MKKIISFIIIVLIVLSGCQTKENNFIQKSIHEDLFSYDISLTLENASISKLEITNFISDYSLNNEAIEYLEEQIVNSQIINVDSYTGATLTSNSVKKTVYEMLEELNIDTKYFVKENIKDDIEVKSLTYDQIIVGAGLSGLTAALRLSESGYRVLVIEKMPFAGGSAALSAGELSVPMLDHTSSNPKESFFNDMYVGSNYTGDEAKLRRIAYHMDEVYEWLIDTVKVQFHDEPYSVQGHSVERINLPINMGKGLINSLLTMCEKNNVDIIYNVEAISLIQDNDSVVGVTTLSNKNEYVNYLSNDKVVLATGGFAHNKHLLDKYNDSWENLNKLHATVSESSNGDGIIMASNVGADLVDMDKIQMFPFTNPATGVNHYMEGNRTILGAIFVNKEGQRFVDEHLNREELSREFLKQTNQTVYQIFNHDILLKTLSFSNAIETYEDGYNQGVLFYSESLDELCKIVGIGNDFVEEFNMEGPFYAIVGTPSIHYTMGGIKTDEESRVLDKTNKIIKGLYAIGETVGGTFGENRLGATSIPDCLVNGYLLGD